MNDYDTVEEMLERELLDSIKEVGEDTDEDALLQLIRRLQVSAFNHGAGAADGAPSVFATITSDGSLELVREMLAKGTATFRLVIEG